MGKSISENTRKQISEILDNLKNSTGDKIRCAILCKKTDGMLYGSFGLELKNAGTLAFSSARIYTNYEIICELLGNRPRRINFAEGVIIVPAGSFAVLAVVLNPGEDYRFMKDKIETSIAQAAGLISKITG